MENFRKILIAVISFLAVFFIAIFIKNNFTKSVNQVDIYFVSSKNKSEIKYVAVKRPFNSEKDKMKTAIESLLQGPNEKEKEKGLYSEIPKETKLLKINQTPVHVEIDLSGNFEYGGGSSSLIARTNQLIKTSKTAADGKPVYLLIDGEKVEVIGGEGIIIEQPLGKTLAE